MLLKTTLIRIGILGSIHHDSSIRYFRLLHQKWNVTSQDTPLELVLYGIDFRVLNSFENKGDLKGYTGYLLEKMTILAGSNPTVALIAANAPHAVFDELQRRAHVPLISIVESTARAIKKNAVKSVLLLGIKFTMQSSFFSERFMKDGVHTFVPSESDQDEIDSMLLHVHEEGNNENARIKLISIIEKSETDAVVLACSELPDIIHPTDTKKKLFDTVAIHVDAVVAHIASRKLE
ncbi:MAG TPA: amino acid racemase [Patescibacteria group bacterium]|nr:amino acid racemase [Patescibacteria group bacterium]